MEANFNECAVVMSLAACRISKTLFASHFLTVVQVGYPIETQIEMRPQAKTPSLETVAKRERVVAALKHKFLSLGLEPHTCEEWLPQANVEGKRKFETQAQACRELLRSGTNFLEAILKDLEARHPNIGQSEPKPPFHYNWP